MKEKYPKCAIPTTTYMYQTMMILDLPEYRLQKKKSESLYLNNISQLQSVLLSSQFSRGQTSTSKSKGRLGTSK